MLRDNERLISESSKDRANVERKLETRQTEKLRHTGRRNSSLILSRVELEAEVHSNGADWCWISQPKTYCVRKIIQVGSGRRLPRKVYVRYIAKHVAAIVKERAT